MNSRNSSTTLLRRTSRWCKAALLGAAFALVGSANAQLSGTKNVPGDYADLAAAITDLNTQGVGVGGVTINVLGGNPQTAPAGGYVIGGTGSLVLTSASTTQQISIVGNGNTVTAPTPQASGNLNDGIFKLIGADWTTISGFTMLENAANTTTAAGTNNMTEWGVALLYITTTDGAQNNTIQNNTIDLDRTYQNTFGIYSNSTHSATSIATNVTATGAAGGNDNLKIYGNTITDVNMGVVHVGPTAAADQNVTADIGGTTAPQGNSITNFGTTATFSGYANVSGTVNGILVRNTKNFNISRNTITSSNGGMTVGGTMNGIQIPASTNAPTGTLTQTINNNTFSLRPGLASTAIIGINMPSTSVNATTTCNMNANDFNTMGHTVAGTGAITFILQGGNPLTQTFNSNTFTNITVNTTGTITFFSFAPNLISTGTMSLSSNVIVTGFTRTGVGTTTVWSSNASSVAGSTQSMLSNNFSNITLTGASAFNGFLNTDGGSPVKTINGNTFDNISTGAGTVAPMSVNFSGPGTVVNTNTITNITTGNSITCLLLGSSNAATLTASGNTIGGINSGGTAVIGISTAGISTVLSKNKIYDLNGSVAGSIVTGITVINAAAGATVTVSNNIVGNLTAPIATSSNGIIGINLSGSAATSNYNVFDNTVYLNNTASGAGFGSSGILALGSATSTTSALNLRGNIIVNTSIQNGAGLTVAYRRSLGTAGALANYASTSNTNDFYAGTPSATNLIYFDGTSNAQTLAAYKAGVFTAGTVAPRDGASVSENPTFVSTTGSNANFLHINTVTPTQLESGGTPIAGITDDFDGNTRDVTTPDIGADEFAGVLLDLSGPSITYTALTNTISVANRTQSITVTDPSGVPVAGIGLPVIYYRKNAGAYFSNQCTSTGGSGYDCVVDNTLIGGVTTGDVIDFYVAAQDAAGTPNASVNPSGGASGLTTNPPAAGTPPTTPNSYIISAPISGTINVGTAETFTSLTRNDAAGIFRYINNNVVTGNVTIECTSDLLIEDGAVALNAFDSPWTITVKPNGAPRTISGAAASTALIRTNGASRFTIDGSTSGGTDRSLTITNTSVTAPQVVRFSGVGLTPYTSNTLKNCIIRNGVNTSSAVVVADAAGAAQNFTNITIQNNDIGTAFIGVFCSATVAPGNGAGLLITQNSLNNAGATAIRNVGLYVQGADGATISSNTVGNFESAIGETDAGIWMASGAGNTTVSGNTVSNLGLTVNGAFSTFGIRESSGLAASGNNITGNTITSIISNTSLTAGIAAITCSSGGTTIQRNNIQGVNNTSTGTFGAFGIDITAGNNCVVKNNFVSGITGDMTGGAAFSTSFGIFGIRVIAGTGHVIVNNSVNLFGARAGTATTGLLTAALGIASTASTGMDIRNNIFANNITGGTTSCANVSIALPSGGTSAMNLTDNKNSYYYGTDARAGAGEQGTTSGAPNLATLATLAAYTSTLHAAATNDNASTASTGAVPYASSSDLHITTSAPEWNTGATIASVTNDIDGETRPQNAAYDIGADEVLNVCSAPTATVGGPQTICELGTTLGLGGNAPGSGIGGWSAVSPGSGGFNPNNTTPNATYTHVGGPTVTLRWTITEAFCPTTFADVVITVNPAAPTATAGGDQNICALGTTTSLGGNAASPGTGTWTVESGGTGTFSNSASPTSTFTHTGGVGPVVVRWTITNAPCTATFDEVSITITPTAPTATAGGDQSICALGTTTSLGGNAATPGVGAWTVESGGTGTFSNAADENSTFTHTSGAGPVVLRWTITNAPCTPSQADVSITITPASLWYGDLDGDGFGNDPTTGTGCTPPNAGDVTNNTDNCPGISNVGQANADADNFGDVCDNCPAVANNSQANADADGLGDACDACPNDAANDSDADGFCADVDNCPLIANPSQANADGDGLGDACDACPNDAANDSDADGFCAD
ncbi:MAG: hypothetical protein ABI432_12290, partial [Flavobacteriales bacterium]